MVASPSQPMPETAVFCYGRARRLAGGARIAVLLGEEDQPLPAAIQRKPCPCGSSGTWQPIASSSLFRSLMRQRSKARHDAVLSAELCDLLHDDARVGLGPIGVINPSFCHAP